MKAPSSRKATRVAVAAAVAILAMTGCSSTTGGADEVPTIEVDDISGSTPANTAAPELPDIAVAPADVSLMSSTPKVAPVRLISADMSIDMPLTPTGVAPDGQVAVPENPAEGGWYKFGSAPGEEQGTAVLYSHVDTLGGLGPFVNLLDAKIGDMVDVILEDGTTVTYQVNELEQVAKADLDTDALFSETGPSRLALVTCGGTWRPEVQSYTDNVIVYATPVS